MSSFYIVHICVPVKTTFLCEWEALSLQKCSLVGYGTGKKIYFLMDFNVSYYQIAVESSSKSNRVLRIKIGALIKKDMAHLVLYDQWFVSILYTH